MPTDRPTLARRSAASKKARRVAKTAKRQRVSNAYELEREPVTFDAIKADYLQALAEHEAGNG